MLSLGIDLGTARARAAIVRGATPELVQFPDGSHWMPSAVSIAEGNVRVGRSALGRAATRPEQTVRSIKRLLGRPYDDKVVQRLRELASFGLEAGQRGALLLRLGDELHEPEEIAAALLRSVIDVVEQRTGERPHNAVLTTPYWYGPAQRTALGNAARLAGLAALQILSEATSTALSLLDADPGERVVAIIDVGAGGCTASVLEIAPRRVRLIASAADPLASGEDIDWAMVKAVLKGLRGRFGDFQTTPALSEMLRQTCEAAKHNLSQMAAVTAIVPFLPVGTGIYNQELVLERETADRMMQDTCLRVTNACRNALQTAGLGKRDVFAVYATGGTTRLPAVRAAIEGPLGPIASRRLDPDGSVALGAATQAAMLDGVLESIPVIDIQSAPSVPPPSVGPAQSLPPAQIHTAPPPASAAEPAFDRVDVGAYRVELAGLLASLRAGALTDGGAGGRKGRRVVARVNEVVPEDHELTATLVEQNTERMRAVWHELALVMQTARQYRWEHPQAERALEQALERIGAALAETPRSIRWDVGSMHFAYEGQVVWKPDRPPFDRIPYELFAEGIRKVQLQPGITLHELRQVLGVLLRDAALGFGVDDDAATALWDCKLEHVGYLAVDAFAEADDPGFAENRDDVAKQLTRLASLSDEGEELLGSYAAAQREAAESAASLALDADTKAALAAGIDPEAEVWLERFAAAFVASCSEAERQGDLDALLASLGEWIAEQVAAHAAGGAFRLFQALLFALDIHPDPDVAKPLLLRLTDAAFPVERLCAVCEDLAGLDEVPLSLVEGLARTLGLQATDEFLPKALDYYGTLRDDSARAALLTYLRRFLVGHEAEVGRLLGTASSDHALDLLSDLRVAATPAALAAVSQALDSPHVEVRMEALAALPEAPAEHVRERVRQIVEDPEQALRFKALDVIADRHIAAAGPVLVRRIQDEAFHELDPTERRKLLDAVAKLNRRRADELAVAMLEAGGMFASQAVDQSRSVAAEFLATSDSPEALEALQKASKKRLFGSVKVREVAARSVSSVFERRSLRPPPRSGGGT